MVHHHIYGFSYAKYIARLLYTNMENVNLSNIHRKKIAASLYIYPKYQIPCFLAFPNVVLVFR